jgi:hypothetical protein
MNIYNTQPLLNEIEIVIKNGLDKMLSKILQRYNLLEKTHNQLMNLPSIKEAIGKDYDDQDVESESETESLNPETDNIVSCQTIMKLDVLNIESKLDKLEKKYAGLYPMLDKILDKIETLNNDVQKMKSSEKNVSVTSCSSSVATPTIVSACENENITFEIKEEETQPSVEEDVEEDVDVEEEVEEELEEAVEELDLTVKVVEKETEEDVEEDEASVETETKSETESVEEEENDDSKSVETETKSEKSEDEEDLEVITIDDIDYCTNNEENGFIWELTQEGEQGTKVGYLKDGEPFFYAEEN